MTTRYVFLDSLLTKDMRTRAVEIAEEFDIPLFAARFMVARGVSLPEDVTRFLNPSLERDWRDPYEIERLSEAVDRIAQAIKDNERILVFGDYDTDGITSTAVMVKAIRELGGTADHYIPSRFLEGYGLSRKAIDSLSKPMPDLVVTVDCGISCREEVAYLKDMGIDVVVTDHHMAGSQVPEGVPVVDPKAEECSPSSILAGVGVALKVVQALGARLGAPYLWRKYTDYAALGTVADCMDLLDENRALVSDGIQRIREGACPCIQALAESSNFNTTGATSVGLSFSLIPKVNAAGRMDDADLAFQLMMADDSMHAKELSLQLAELNEKRKAITDETTEQAIRMAEKHSGEKVIVVAGEGWNDGIVGIVAARLADRFDLPSIVLTIEGDKAKGSGRNVGDIDMFKALESVSGLLTRFGGHKAAVGVTLPVADIDAFREALNSYMEGLPQEEFSKEDEIDVVDISDLTIDNVEKFQRLQPFGNKNEEPLFLAKDVMFSDIRIFGNGSVFKAWMTSRNSKVSAIRFRYGSFQPKIEENTLYDVVFTVDINHFRGERSVQVKILEVIDPEDRVKLGALSDDELIPSHDDRPVVDDRASAGCLAKDPDRAMQRKKWKELGETDGDELNRAIVRALIGDGRLHESQEKALRLLGEGKSVMTVMGTGRGKSLIFQTHAANLALRSRKCSLFVYPLRALISDQAFHIQENFKSFGLVCKVLNGQTPQDEREAIYEAISNGGADIVLTTPEYLRFHSSQIAKSGKIGFVVIDEAHHIGQARAQTRPAYEMLKEPLSEMGDPQVLAVTATANQRISDKIREELDISELVIDDSERSNLQLDDCRGTENRDDYVARILASGEKCVVYVNSRDQTVSLVRRLRNALPDIAPSICFYNAGMSREERGKVEELFRDGAVRALVATSAFGEGIDIPDIRHVILYHMPFSDIEFNQMSGRAGRDGEKSCIHLLFGKKDSDINKAILSTLAPTRDVLVKVYKQLKRMWNESACGVIDFTCDSFAEKLDDGRRHLEPSCVACALRIFNELGLIDLRTVPSQDQPSCVASVPAVSSKVNLEDSVLYMEGIAEMEDFKAFEDWVLKCDPKALRDRIVHPIKPTVGD